MHGSRVGEGASIGKNAGVGVNCRIGPKATVGEGATLMPEVTLGQGATMAMLTTATAQTVIENDATVEYRSRIGQAGDQRTVIGRGATIRHHSSITGGLQIPNGAEVKENSTIVHRREVAQHTGPNNPTAGAIAAHAAATPVRDARTGSARTVQQNIERIQRPRHDKKRPGHRRTLRVQSIRVSTLEIEIEHNETGVRMAPGGSVHRQQTPPLTPGAQSRTTKQAEAGGRQDRRKHHVRKNHTGIRYP